MNKNDLVKEFATRGLIQNSETIDLLLKFKDATLTANESFNLTAIKENEFIEKMIFDSAISAQGINLENKEVIDVGTGAGYPGMVLQIMNPNASFTLLDSTEKKINFINQFAKENSIKINAVSDRCEAYAKTHREHFDYAFARAVAPLNILLELIMPILKVGGTFIALKGKGYEEEIKQSDLAFKKLGCKVSKIVSDYLPECGEERYMIHIVKQSSTNNKYPRDYSEIKKKPL